MSAKTGPPRAVVLCEKLGNFFTFLASLECVKRNPKAIQAINTSSDMILRLNPQTGMMLGYDKAKAYIDEWIIPAYERVEIKTDVWVMRLKSGDRPGTETEKPIKWYDWLMENNVKYWEIEPDQVTKKDMDKIFKYLNCFAVLTSPFNSKESTKQEQVAMFQPPTAKKAKIEE